MGVLGSSDYVSDAWDSIGIIESDVVILCVLLALRRDLVHRLPSWWHFTREEPWAAVFIRGLPVKVRSTSGCTSAST